MTALARLRRRAVGTPLRVRLVAALTALALAGLALAGVATVTALRSYLLDRVDRDLTSAVDGPLVGGFDGGPGRAPDGDRRGAAPGQFYIQRFTPAGQPIETPVSQPPGTGSPDLPTLTADEVRQRQGVPFTVPGRDGGSWRVVATVDAGGSPVAVAAPLSDVSSTLSRLIWLEVGIGLTVVVLTAAAGWVVVRRSLRPLVAVESTAAAIAAGDLTQRVPAADERTEVGRLAAALNVMLARIESAFDSQARSERAARASEERMRRFVADASHELRTPLTSIRGFAELHRMGAVSGPQESARLIGRIEAESQRMGGLVEDMLSLARLDEARPLRSDPVDLAVIAADVVDDARLIASDRRIGCDCPPGAVVIGDEERLRQVVHNLVGNALRHTPAGTPVEVAVASTGHDVVLTVRDHGPGIAAEHLEHVFERFYRTDAARTRAAGGSGLGLAIVADIVAGHDGTVDANSSPGQGATFRVRLPARRPDADQPNGQSSRD